MPHFSLKDASIILSDALTAVVNDIANRYFAATGKDIVVTSGFRTPAEQAAAMYEKLAEGGKLTVYIDQASAGEVQDAYQSGLGNGDPSETILASMADVITQQVTANRFLSLHLTGRAVDVRSSDMAGAEQEQFRLAVTQVTGNAPIFEGRPQHFHFQVSETTLHSSQ